MLVALQTIRVHVVLPVHPGACGERAQSAQSIHIPARAGERRRSACALLAGGVFGGVIDHDCDVFGNRGMLRIQAAGTAGGGSAGRSGEGWILFRLVGLRPQG